MQLLRQSLYIKRYHIKLMLCSLCLLWVGCGKKQVELEIKKVKTIPVVDGKIDKVWDEAEWTDIGTPPTDSAKKANLSAKFKVVRDQANFYFLVEVTDDIKFRRTLPKSALEAKYDFIGQGMNDCVFVTLVVGDTKKTTEDTRIMYIYDYPAVVVNGKATTLSDFKVGQTNVPGGYMVEARVPFTELKYTPDLPIVAKIAVMDNDSTFISEDSVTLPTKTIVWGTPLVWGTKDLGKLIVKN